MKISNKIIIFIVIIFCSCQQKEQFSLTGKTKDFNDGEMIYLRLNNTIIDSAKVVNNQFEFNTKLENYPANVILLKKDFSQYRFLWIEDKEMTFDATQSDFRNATVSGSETENISQELASLKKNLKPGNSGKIKIEQDFVKNHPNSIVSASVLSIYSSTWGKKKTEELYNFLSEEVKNTTYGKEIQNYINLAVEPTIGDKYVDFTMNDVDGNSLQLSELEGKLILLEFWASWCGPCRAENPNLVKSYENYKDKGFEIFAVSLDAEKESWEKAIAKDNLPWKHVSDLAGDKNKASIIYGISGIPDNFLINSEGVIVARNVRGDVLNNKLKELLN